ncbi:MAG: hypothetical protein WCA10_24925 [Terracidiphilus sp.]
MKKEWRKFNPRDPNTHPKDNSRVELKYTDGTQFSGGYLRGHFLQGGVISAASVHLSVRWRYTQ